MKKKQGGFLKLIILIVVVLLLLRYFDLTITGVLAYFGLSWSMIVDWAKEGFTWLLDLFKSVK